MQASKLKIDDICAIRDDANKLVPFRVASVTTTRRGNSPSDYSSTVSGFILNDDMSQQGGAIAISPDKLLGYYKEHAELVERRRVADAEKARAAKADKDLALDLAREFYQMIGQPMPNDVASHHAAVRVGYSNSVEISFEVVATVLARLRGKVSEAA